MNKKTLSDFLYSFVFKLSVINLRKYTMSLLPTSKDNVSEDLVNGLDCVEDWRTFLCKAVMGTIELNG